MIVPDPHKKCGVEGCNNMIVTRNFYSNGHTVCIQVPHVCGHHGGEIIRDIPMKARIIQASRARKRRVKAILQGMMPSPLHDNVRGVVMSYLGEDLGQLRPSPRWLCLLEISGFPYAIGRD